MENLNDLTVAVISKAINEKAAKAARNNVSVGDHDVDVMIRLQGTFSVSPDTEKIGTCKVPVLATLVRVMKKAGFMGPRIVEMVLEAAREEMEGGEKDADTVAMEAAIKRAEDTIRAEIAAKLPKIPVKGRAKFNGTISEIGTTITAE